MFFHTGYHKPLREGLSSPGSWFFIPIRQFFICIQDHMFSLPMCIYFSHMYSLYINFLMHIFWCDSYKYVVSEVWCANYSYPIYLSFLSKWCAVDMEWLFKCLFPTYTSFNHNYFIIIFSNMGLFFLRCSYKL